jgi:hypothetical protein
MNKPFPKGWENYDIHTEVKERDYWLIQHLEKTKWEYFADGGEIICDSGVINENGITRWYGLKRDFVLDSGMIACL